MSIFNIFKSNNSKKSTRRVDKLGDRTYRSFLNASLTNIERYLRENGLDYYLYLASNRYAISEKMRQKAIENKREYIIYY